MKKLLFFLSIIAISLVSPNQVKADVVYNDFGAGNSYNITHGQLLSTIMPFAEQANAFTPTANYKLTSIEMAVDYFMGSNNLNVWLMNDNGGKPGTALEYFQFSNLGSVNSTNPLLVGQSSTNLALNQGQQYWLAAAPRDTNTWLGWNFNNINATGIHYSSNNLGNTWNLDNPNQFAAFRINGTPIAATPEPVSMLLFGVGGLAMAAFKKKKGC